MGIKKIMITVDAAQPFRALGQQPPMARVQISLIDRPIRMLSNRHWITLHRSPEVGDEVILVVDRLRLSRFRPSQQHRAGAKKRLHIVFCFSEPLPHHVGNGRLPAKPWERRLQLSVSDDLAPHAAAIL